MNKIMETTSVGEESATSSADGGEPLSDLNASEESNTAKLEPENYPSSPQKTLAIDDDDINDFFNNDKQLLTETIVKTADEKPEGSSKEPEENSEEAREPPVGSSTENGVLFRNQPVLKDDSFEYLEESVKDEVVPNENVEELDEKVTRTEVKEDPQITNYQETVQRENLDDFDNEPVASSSRQDERAVESPANLREEVVLDNKSIKSISDQNLQQRDLQGSSPSNIPHDSDSGVYVDPIHPDGRTSTGGRRRNPLGSSQDDLQVLEGRERPNGSANSFQRLSQSDDEEEVINKYSKAYKTKLEKVNSKRIRYNYEMGPPESRHVYYSSRPKKMPPNREDLDLWKDSSRWQSKR